MYSPEDFTLNGQVAVITGAGAAIGRAIARTFAGAGAAVNATSPRLTPQTRGGWAACKACNLNELTDASAILDVIERCIEAQR